MCEPAGGSWSCNINYYGTNDGCDCGCGVIDPDCSSNFAGACGFTECPAGTSVLTEANWLCGASVCGNGFVEPGETCDDGDTSLDWDCDAQCQVNSPSCPYNVFYDGQCDCGCDVFDPDCVDASAAACEENHCTGGYVPADSRNFYCVPVNCGNGVIDPGEGCDDGNFDNDDGCYYFCQTP